MRVTLLSCGTALVLATATAADAATIDNFILTSGTDIIAFSLPEPIVPPILGTLLLDFAAPVTFNGSATTNYTEDFQTTYTISQFGVAFKFAGDWYNFVETGPSTYTGPATAPVFNGTTTFTSAIEEVNGVALTNPPIGTLTVTKTPSFAATPEPSSLVLLGTGLLAACGAVRRRFFKL